MKPEKVIQKRKKEQRMNEESLEIMVKNLLNNSDASPTEKKLASIMLALKESNK
jgi:hypothetical protein